MATETPPTSEIGAVHPFSGVPGWSAIMFELERAVELRWPSSIATYDAMLNDTQLEGLYKGSVLPVRRYRWAIDKRDARQEVVDRLSNDLGLATVDGDPPKGRRRGGRFSFPEHLRVALKALLYGHYFFEQVGEIYEDNGREWVRLKKLAPRPPRTLADIRVAKDGGLESVAQAGSLMIPGAEAGRIPVSRLVAYVWDQDPGVWTGRSMFRSSFRNYAIKDRLMRVDALKLERTGMGVPVVKGAEGDGDEEAKALLNTASRVRAGEQAAAYLNHGQELTLEGVRGSVPDTIASIRWHDEQMSKAFLMMFMELGMSATGSRALGSEFIDFFAYAQEALADWFVAVFEEHVIEDWVNWNYGTEEPAPGLIYHRNDDEDLPTADLAQMVNAGLIVVDDELEDYLRAKHNLPARDPNRPKAKPPATPPTDEEVVDDADKADENGEEQELPAAMVAASRLRLKHGTGGARASAEFRRELLPHEVAAATDFEAMDLAYVNARDALVLGVQALQAAQITELGDQVEAAAGDLTALNAITASPVAGPMIENAMNSMGAVAMGQALEEAKAQGISPKTPALPDYGERAAVKAEVLASTLTDAARRKAASITGGELTAAAVALAVREHLSSLSSAFLEQELGGVLTAAQNSARRAVFAANPPKRIYASELLDANTCAPCAEIDGKEYADLSAAEVDYPVGAYAECEGGGYCRGTLIAEW